MNFMITMGEKETPESGIYGLASSVDNNELWDVYGFIQFCIVSFIIDCIVFAFNAKNPQSVQISIVPMLELGLVDDVDATLDEMIQKCYDSGLQTVKDEFNAQYEAWYATR